MMLWVERNTYSQYGYDFVKPWLCVFLCIVIKLFVLRVKLSKKYPTQKHVTSDSRGYFDKYFAKNVPLLKQLLNLHIAEINQFTLVRVPVDLFNFSVPINNHIKSISLILNVLSPYKHLRRLRIEYTGWESF